MAGVEEARVFQLRKEIAFKVTGRQAGSRAGGSTWQAGTKICRFFTIGFERKKGW